MSSDIYFVTFTMSSDINFVTFMMSSDINFVTFTMSSDINFATLILWHSDSRCPVTLILWHSDSRCPVTLILWHSWCPVTLLWHSSRHDVQWLLFSTFLSSWCPLGCYSMPSAVARVYLFVRICWQFPNSCFRCWCFCDFRENGNRCAVTQIE